MDDKGSLIIPAQFRKDGKAFVGNTFEETKVLEEQSVSMEGNRHDRRKASAIDAKLRKIAALETK
mgnify:CR=1 FL=1